MAILGYQSLCVSLVLLLYAALAYAWSSARGTCRWLASAQRATWVAFVLTSVSVFALLHALLSRDFQIEYVARYSNRSLSPAYTLAAFWAGQDGSLLLWTWLLTLFSIMVLRNKKRLSELLPVVMTILSLITFFFVYLTLFNANPFQPGSFTPLDGTGLNPLLQNPEMIFHPPALYIGFVGFSVPFAMAMAALVKKQLDEKWLKAVRRWTLFSWLFLTIGNLLGMQWAYVELGWGGYWAWDPVENASLLPWLTATAFLHSIMVQERKAMLKTWNMTLVTLTFCLTIFGTFITRSGLISSVHAFGVSNLGPLFLGFLAAVSAGSAVLIFRRRRLLAGKNEIHSWSAKEASFMINNLLFLALTVGVFIGTIMPSLSEWLFNKKMIMNAEFFNRFSTPIGMAIFLLLGVCTLLTWGKTDSKALLRTAALPAGLGLFALVLLLLCGIHQPMALLALGIAFFGIWTTKFALMRAALIRQKTEQVGLPKAVLDLIWNNKRRYGGYLVHIGVLLLFLAMIGSSAFNTEKTATLQKGESLQVGAYELTYQGLAVIEKTDREIHRALFQVRKSGHNLGEVHSEKQIHENFQPATEVGMRSTLLEDLYIILASYDLQSQTATVDVLVNPLMLWMWIGGAVMALGAILALLPSKKQSSRQ